MTKPQKPTRLRPSQCGKMRSTPMPGLTNPLAPPRTVVPEYDPAKIWKKKPLPPKAKVIPETVTWEAKDWNGGILMPATLLGVPVPRYICAQVMVRIFTVGIPREDRMKGWKYKLRYFEAQGGVPLSVAMAVARQMVEWANFPNPHHLNDGDKDFLESLEEILEAAD